MKYKFTVSDWLMVVGGVVMALHPLVFNWAKIAAPGDPRDGESGYHPFSYVTTGGLAWILVVAVGVVAALIGLDIVKRESAPWPLILVVGSAIGAVLMAVRVLAGAGEEADTNLDLDPDAGMYVALVAGAISLAGAVIALVFTASSTTDATASSATTGGDSAETLPPPAQ